MSVGSLRDALSRADRSPQSLAEVDVLGEFEIFLRKHLLSCAIVDFMRQPCQFHIVADEERLFLGAVALGAVGIELVAVGIEMVAVVVHAIGFRLDAESDGLRGIAGRRDCHLAAPSLVGQRQCDGLSAVGNSVGDTL